MDLQKDAEGSSSKACAAPCDANQIMSIKVEGVSDSEEEEEDHMQLRCLGIKIEHEEERESSSETHPTSHDANQIAGIKVEGVSDTEEEEEDHVELRCSGIKTEHEDLEETEQEITQKSVPPGISAHSSVSNQNAELSISTGSDISSYGCSFKRKKNLPASDQILVAVGDRLAQVKNEDRFDFFAKNVAAKLRALRNNEQRIYAEKLINDALFEAELGSLSSYSSINTGLRNHSSQC
ncbi:hypothetical protein B7P43_G11834 [Cryptotermes secundus]|uniref:Uncharacterized protein n=1 Tax=Cryptotermes secundus TaxID=105785 RepID=A0A2J7RQ22_9NEOP|nr:hypothetical protein B7P43_G11834 [Cryptotermes secundus]